MWLRDRQQSTLCRKGVVVISRDDLVLFDPVDCILGFVDSAHVVEVVQ